VLVDLAAGEAPGGLRAPPAHQQAPVQARAHQDRAHHRDPLRRQDTLATALFGSCRFMSARYIGAKPEGWASVCRTLLAGQGHDMRHRLKWCFCSVDAWWVLNCLSTDRTLENRSKLSGRAARSAVAVVDQRRCPGPVCSTQLGSWPAHSRRYNPALRVICIGCALSRVPDILSRSHAPACTPRRPCRSCPGTRRRAP